jgi:hypothetical protein
LNLRVNTQQVGGVETKKFLDSCNGSAYLAKMNPATAEMPMLDASHYNLPKTENLMINSRGQNLHFRIFDPRVQGEEEQKELEGEEKNTTVTPMGICFWVHGFGGHSNRPEIQNLAKYFNKKGYFVIALGKSLSIRSLPNSSSMSRILSV